MNETIQKGLLPGAEEECQSFPTHPHYHSPGMTYFLGLTHKSASLSPQTISYMGLCSVGGGVILVLRRSAYGQSP